MFLKNLPQNSPFRRPLLQVMTVNLHVKTVAADFDVSQETIYASHRSSVDANILMSMRSTPNVKRNRLPDEDLDLARTFMDEVFPQLSGRDFRVIAMTRNSVYAVYFGYCTDRDQVPLGQTTFNEKIFNKMKIHNTADSTICCYCRRLKTLEHVQPRTAAQEAEYGELVEHKERWFEQGRFFGERKNTLIDHKQRNVLIVVQDFTQLQLQGTFYQDFIVVFQEFDQEEASKLKTRMHHFVAPTTNTKNDGTFVIRVWLHMINEGWFYRYDTIEIFSDGAGKHFKTTAIMNFFAFMQMFLKKCIIYHFFESNHGHSVCDAAASHVKKAINVFQRDKGEAVRVPPQVVDVANGIKNHDAMIAPIQPDIIFPEFDTFHGIRKLRKFTFDEEYAYGYRISRLGHHEMQYPLMTESYADIFLNILE